MKEDELRNALSNAAEGCQLSEYRKRQIVAQMKGEKPVKKKLTVSAVLVMIIMLLTLSVAAALVHSTIVEHLFGSSEDAPRESCRENPDNAANNVIRFGRSVFG